MGWIVLSFMFGFIAGFVLVSVMSVNRVNKECKFDFKLDKNSDKDIKEIQRLYEVEKALNNMGVTMFRDFDDVMGDVAKEWHKSGSKQEIKLTNEMNGKKKHYKNK